ncbi:Uncharacterised protein [Bordetella pertussis]|nr:Uncharacterised protein [Bordetella pertussis]
MSSRTLPMGARIAMPAPSVARLRTIDTLLTEKRLPGVISTWRSPLFRGQRVTRPVPARN